MNEKQPSSLRTATPTTRSRPTYTSASRNHQGVSSWLVCAPWTEKRKGGIRNFHDWIYDTFGDGIAKHLLVPYNEKIWQHDLRDIDLDWVNWSIPNQILRSAKRSAWNQEQAVWIQPCVFLPTEGGFRHSQQLSGGREVDSRRSGRKDPLKKRRVTLRSGQVVRYRHLLSTMRCIPF